MKKVILFILRTVWMLMFIALCPIIVCGGLFLTLYEGDLQYIRRMFDFKNYNYQYVTNELTIRLMEEGETYTYYPTIFHWWLRVERSKIYTDGHD